MKDINLLVVGVGGQGVVLASDIIGEVALAAGYDVKKTDTLGMAQRGGSVVSHLRLAEKVWSPLIAEGEADIILSFEKLEAARWSHYLRSGGAAIINNYAQPPPSVSLGKEKYPADEELLAILKRQTDKVYLIEGTRRSGELGNARVLNMYMLGCISAFLPLTMAVLKDSITRRLPAGIQKINLAAFDRGRKEVLDVHIRED